MGRLANKICLLMGGGGSADPQAVSNGQATAISFAREGATVVVVDQDLDAAQETVRQIEKAGGAACAWRADVSSHEDVREAVRHAISEHERIDVLYNNVGIEFRGGVLDTPEDAWDRVHDVNLKSIFLTCKEVVPLMIKQGGGCIVNVSSTASLRWGPVEYIAYNSSKAAINHMTRVMARQYAPHNVRCNVILPGMIDTPHVRALLKDESPDGLTRILADRDARCPMGRQGTPWEVASAAVFLASDEASYVTGVLLPVDGALSV